MTGVPADRPKHRKQVWHRLLASFLIGGPAIFALGLVMAPNSSAAAKCAGKAEIGLPATPWAQQRLNPQGAWVLTRGAGVVVAVVDTGVSATAPALAGAVLPGRDVSTDGPADSDCSGHGTFIAGLLAARASAGHGLVGIAPRVRVLPIRVAVESDKVNAGALAKGIRAAVDGGAPVIAVGVSTSTAPTSMRNAVDYATAHGALVVASTDSMSTSTGPVYPAALPGVLAVASVTSSGAPSSSDGGSTPPSIAAPGDGLTSIAPHGGGNVTGSGNGAEVAFAAGTAALIHAYRPDLSAAQLRARLEATADQPSGNLPDPLTGYGIVDPTAAVSTDLPQESRQRTPNLIPAEPIQYTMPTPANTLPIRTALAASAGIIIVTGTLGLAILLARRGRQRNWRPAGSMREIERTP